MLDEYEKHYLTARARLLSMLRQQRLGAAFAVLAMSFVGVGAVAFTEQPSPEQLAPHVSAAPLERPMVIGADRLLLQGYDPVAYFVERRARPGVRAWQVRWGQARLRFVSRVNRDAFLREPNRFAPRFGGHDAMAARMGELRDGDPRAFRIVDDKLYLMSDVDAAATFDEAPRRNAAVAEAVWPKLAALHAR